MVKMVRTFMGVMMDDENMLIELIYSGRLTREANITFRYVDLRQDVDPDGNDLIQTLAADLPAVVAACGAQLPVRLREKVERFCWTAGHACASTKEARTHIDTTVEVWVNVTMFLTEGKIHDQGQEDLIVPTPVAIGLKWRVEMMRTYVEMILEELVRVWRQHMQNREWTTKKVKTKSGTWLDMEQDFSQKLLEETEEEDYEGGGEGLI